MAGATCRRTMIDDGIRGYAAACAPPAWLEAQRYSDERAAEAQALHVEEGLQYPSITIDGYVPARSTTSTPAPGLKNSADLPKPITSAVEPRQLRGHLRPGVRSRYPAMSGLVLLVGVACSAWSAMGVCPRAAVRLRPSSGHSRWRQAGWLVRARAKRSPLMSRPRSVQHFRTLLVPNGWWPGAASRRRSPGISGVARSRYLDNQPASGAGKLGQRCNGCMDATHPGRGRRRGPDHLAAPLAISAGLSLDRRGDARLSPSA